MTKDEALPKARELCEYLDHERIQLDDTVEDLSRQLGGRDWVEPAEDCVCDIITYAEDLVAYAEKIAELLENEVDRDD